jgi:hypothetical protein
VRQIGSGSSEELFGLVAGEFVALAQRLGEAVDG